MITTPKAVSSFSVQLESYLGNMFAVTDKVMELVLVEDIESFALTGHIRILDNAALQAVVPIIGQERFHIAVSKEMSADNDAYGTAIMRVTRVSRVDSHEGNTASLTFDLVDEKTFINDTSVFSRAMSGSPTTIMEKIHNEVFKPVNGLPLNVISPSSNSYTYVFTNVTPYKAYDMLMFDAWDSKQTPIFMWDSFWNVDFSQRTKVMSLYDMMQQTPVEIADAVVTNNDENGAVTKTGPRYVGNADDISLVYGYDTSKMLRNGVLGCEVRDFDIHTKTITTNRFDATKHAPALNSPIYTPRHLVGGRGITEIGSTAVYNRVSASYSHDSAPTLNVNIDDISAAASRSYYGRMMDTMTVNISIDSDIDIAAGKLVEFDIQRNAPNLNNKEDLKDTILSGVYVIKSVAHRFFDKEYKMMLTVVRESASEDIDL